MIKEKKHGENKINKKKESKTEISSYRLIAFFWLSSIFFLLSPTKASDALRISQRCLALGC